MLDSFEIISTSGVVLWSRLYEKVDPSLINDFLVYHFIEENPWDSASAYTKNGKTIKWVASKELGLIFVATYQSILHISWVDELLSNVRELFTSLYKDQLEDRKTSKITCPFDPYFDKQLEKFEKSVTISTSTTTLPPHIIEPEPDTNRLSSQFQNTSLSDSSRPASPASAAHVINGNHTSGPKGSRRARKAASAASAVALAAATVAMNGSSTPGASGDESLRKQKPRKEKKKMRKWGVEGPEDDEGDVQLDFSENIQQNDSEIPMNISVKNKVLQIDSSSWGTKTSDGHFMLKDIGEEINGILDAVNEKKSAEKSSSSGLVDSISGLFRGVIGGKVITKEDLSNPLQSMQEHLIKKNVAIEAAKLLCDHIGTELEGTKTSSFTSVDSMVKPAMEKTLRRMLTPTTPLDFLREIQSVQGKRPYVISIVGVNGVGKSTNLSKICFFLLQNKYRVLIAAGDTFRSGAVEQLRVHVKNLQELTERQQAGHVDIFERGYGKDAAAIARDAVQYAAQNKFDVVLIDTAGRRHNDQRLMSSLERFANLAQPDKILMVGEALVGTDSVGQARNFDKAFGPGRHLDGFIISKCDTVGDMIGTLVSMVYATGIPVLFLGTGQHYSDLRMLKAESVVELLMRS